MLNICYMMHRVELHKLWQLNHYNKYLKILSLIKVYYLQQNNLYNMPDPRNYYQHKKYLAQNSKIRKKQSFLKLFLPQKIKYFPKIALFSAFRALCLHIVVQGLYKFEIFSLFHFHKCLNRVTIIQNQTNLHQWDKILDQT